MGTLGESSSKESGVQAEQYPRTTLKEHGRKEDADPEKDLQR